MTHTEQVTALDRTKTFHIFRAKKSVATGDKYMQQTESDEVVYNITCIHASPGLMKGYTAVGLELAEGFRICGGPAGAMLLQPPVLND